MLSHLLKERELSTPERMAMKWPSECLNCMFGIVVLMDVRWDEYALIAAYCKYEFLGGLVVEDMPIYIDDLGVFPDWWMSWCALMRALVLWEFIHLTSMYLL